MYTGYQAGSKLTTGNNNIIIGPKSGTAVTEGSDNVLMGYNRQAEDGLHNATAIGANARVAISNALILGSEVNVGIGTSSPATRLEVDSKLINESGLRLTNLTSYGEPTSATDQFLTVNEKGDVVKARYQLRISNADEWSDKVFEPSYPLRSLTAVAAYINQHRHLPGVPAADQVVREGVNLARINATLLEKIEELTLYSIQLEKKNQKQEAILQQQTQALQAIKEKQTQLEQIVQSLLNRK